MRWGTTRDERYQGRLFACNCRSELVESERDQWENQEKALTGMGRGGSTRVVTRSRSGAAAADDEKKKIETKFQTYYFTMAAMCLPISASDI